MTVYVACDACATYDEEHDAAGVYGVFTSRELAEKTQAEVILEFELDQLKTVPECIYE